MRCHSSKNLKMLVAFTFMGSDALVRRKIKIIAILLWLPEECGIIFYCIFI